MIARSLTIAALEARFILLLGASYLLLGAVCLKLLAKAVVHFVLTKAVSGYSRIRRYFHATERGGSACLSHSAQSAENIVANSGRTI